MLHQFNEFESLIIDCMNRIVAKQDKILVEKDRTTYKLIAGRDRNDVELHVYGYFHTINAANGTKSPNYQLHTVLRLSDKYEDEDNSRVLDFKSAAIFAPTTVKELASKSRSPSPVKRHSPTSKSRTPSPS